MDRAKHLDLADAAVRRAERLADKAENAATHADHQRNVQPLATAGALWADIARAHADIAAALNETEA